MLILMAIDIVLIGRATDEMGEHFAANSADHRGVAAGAEPVALLGSHLLLAQYHRADA